MENAISRCCKSVLIEVKVVVGNVNRVARSCNLGSNLAWTLKADAKSLNSRRRRDRFGLTQLSSIPESLLQSSDPTVSISSMIARTLPPFFELVGVLHATSTSTVHCSVANILARCQNWIDLGVARSRMNSLVYLLVACERHVFFVFYI